MRERIARAEETGAEAKNNAAPKIGDISEEKEEKRTTISRKGLDSGAGKRYNRRKRELGSGGCADRPDTGEESMRIQSFTVISAYDNLALACVAYEPESSPKGVFQIVHGMCERKERYDKFMRFLAEHGFVAVAHDHRGHGASVVSDADLGWFRDRKAVAIVEDAVQVTRVAKERYPGLPVVLFGHSMGSMIVRCYLQKHDAEIDKLVVCGSPSKNSLAGAGLALAKSIALTRGERYRSPMLAQLSTGNGDKKFPGEGRACWLTRDRSVTDAYNADPKCNFIFTCNGYENLFRLMQSTYNAGKYEVRNPSLPILFVSGSDDAVLISEEKWFASQQFLRDVGYRNVSGKLYHQMRHEILNEIGKEEVYADLLAFAEKDVTK